MLLQMIPSSMPLWAVFAGPEGETVIHPVACLGMMVLDPETDRRAIVAFCVDKHCRAADLDPSFVSLSTSPDPTAWVEKCKQKRADMEEKKRNQKIIVPGGEKVVLPN